MLDLFRFQSLMIIDNIYLFIFIIFSKIIVMIIIPDVIMMRKNVFL